MLLAALANLSPAGTSTLPQGPAGLVEVRTDSGIVKGVFLISPIRRRDSRPVAKSQYGYKLYGLRTTLHAVRCTDPPQCPGEERHLDGIVPAFSRGAPAAGPEPPKLRIAPLREGGARLSPGRAAVSCTGADKGDESRPRGTERPPVLTISSRSTASPPMYVYRHTEAAERTIAAWQTPRHVWP